jgi:hypothetical protein
MPPHLHRRPPLRQHLPAQRALLLLPPHHPQASPTQEPRPKIQLRPPTPRRPLRNPIRHRNDPPTHSLERPRPSPSRPTPLRPPNRQPEPTQTAARSRRRRSRTSPRDHHPPRTRHSSPTNRDQRRKELRSPTPRRTHPTKTRSPTADSSHSRYLDGSETWGTGGPKVVPGEQWRITHLSNDETVAKMGHPATSERRQVGWLWRRSSWRSGRCS